MSSLGSWDVTYPGRGKKAAKQLFACVQQQYMEIAGLPPFICSIVTRSAASAATCGNAEHVFRSVPA